MNPISTSSNQPQLASASITRGETVLHVLFMAIAAIVLLMSFVMSSQGESQVFLPGVDFPLPGMCSSQVLFGIKCPGCGLTRAFISISHGQFSRAWHFNQASFLVYMFVVIQIPWHGFQLWRIQQGRSRLEFGLVYLTPIGLALLLCANWIANLMGY